MSTKQQKEKIKHASKEKKDAAEIDLEEENEKLKIELSEKNDKLLRSYADFQNYQKRMDKELQHREEATKKNYLNEILDIYDLLKKASEDENPKIGLNLLLQNIENFLNKEKICYIDCLGKTFDHNIHHAISTIDKDNCEENTIVEEIKKGYYIDDKVLRPSQVVVKKKKEKN